MMFNQVLENLQKATESSIRLQQEMFQKWTESLSGAPPVPTAADGLIEWRKKWEAASSDLLKRQKELVDRNYEAGISALEHLFQVSDARSPQELQQKVMELYQSSFDSLRRLSETQMSEFKSASEKLFALMSTNGRS